MILVVLMLDVSGSMALGSRIEALNSNVRTLLALLQLRPPQAVEPTPFWIAIASCTDVPMWIVEEPTPPEEVPWADLQPRKRQRADLVRAIADAEQYIAAQVPEHFDEALLVVVTDRSAAAAVPAAESAIQRVTMLVDAASNEAQNASPETILERATVLVR